jgi:hypothetical protein
VLVAIAASPARAGGRHGKPKPKPAPAPAPAPAPEPAPAPPPVEPTPEMQAKEAAVRLLGEGIERYQAGDYQGAVARFYAAYEIVPSPKIYLNIANALIKLGRDPEAADGYEKFLVEAANNADIDDEKRTLAKTELAKLQARLGRIQVLAKPATSSVSLDGKLIDTSKKPMYVTAGTHELAISAHGYIPRKDTIVVKPGAVDHLDIALELLPPPEAVVAHKEAVKAARTKKIWGVIVGVAGLGTAGVGVKYLLDSRDLAAKAKACTPADPCTANALKSYDTKGNRANTLSTVFFATGGGLFLAGTVLFVVGAVQGSGEAPRVGLAPTAGGALATWGLTF